MYLISIDAVTPHINSYYLTYRRGSRLLGFMPCSQPQDAWAKYYSVETERGRVVPVFYVPDMVFDSEAGDAKPGPALYFMGCDDGHTGLKFESEAQAMQWLNDCPYGDFEFLFRDASNGVIPKLHFHN